MIAQYEVARVSLSTPYFGKFAELVSPQDMELKLQRTYINMFLDVDFGLAMLVAEIFDYNQADIRSVVLKNGKKNIPLHQLTVCEKIEACKQGLKEFHGQIFENYSEDLEHLDVLKVWKNLFAYHSPSGFITNEILSFEDLLDAFKSNAGNYNQDALWEDIHAYRQSIMKTLKTLHQILVPYSSPLAEA